MKAWLVILLVLFQGQQTISNEFPSFKEYVALFNKNYSLNLRSLRQQVYETNLKQIQEHNNNPIHTWKMGVNAFTDLSWDEFWSSRQGIRTSSRNLFEDWDENITNRIETRSNPPSLNWSNYLNPVQDQGQCGSCWAFASVTAIESAFAIQTRLLYNLSEQQVVDCTRTAFGCNGGWMHNAYQYARSTKLCSVVSYPYQAQQNQCRQMQCRGYVKVRRTTPFYGEKNLLNAVSQQPIAIAIGISPDFQHYKSGVFNGSCSNRPNHAVVVVGYTPTEWIIQNSWGTTWGEKGWMRIVKDRKLCGIGNYRSDILSF
ncbi:hypothetical protein EBU71_18735 [bacterium]|nr:hypothetical protein [Candidatus Elulimicrobium humile]